jgi:hypothetical protein
VHEFPIKRFELLLNITSQVKDFTKAGTLGFSPHVAAFKHFKVLKFAINSKQFKIRGNIVKESHTALDDARLNADHHIQILRAMETLENAYGRN